MSIYQPHIRQSQKGEICGGDLDKAATLEAWKADPSKTIKCTEAPSDNLGKRGQLPEQLDEP